MLFRRPPPPRRPNLTVVPRYHARCRGKSCLGPSSGTTSPWSWPAGAGPETIVETTNFDEWIEFVAADRGFGAIPDVAVRRNIHPGVRLIALRGAPESPVSLAFLARARNAVLRRFVKAALQSGQAI
ncbi:LysR substrate-binding domain-containing protein [Mycobacterium interjectum]|uniref:LysR substrate-binding domain-containing protein n=1 Tax=Mycobacterium interjectum TaxID=33895 RepID=UPI001F420FBB|nr:LysR substrate-binding domain-containing protein [Mycobacterium interjectum]